MGLLAKGFDEGLHSSAKEVLMIKTSQGTWCVGWKIDFEESVLSGAAPFVEVICEMKRTSTSPVWRFAGSSSGCFRGHH